MYSCLEILVVGFLLGQSGNDSCAKLLEALDSAGPKQRLLIVHKIGTLGRHGAGAVTVLENLLHDANDELGNEAARSLAQIGAASVPALSAATSDSHPVVQLRALWAIGVMGPEARAAIPELVKLLEHPHERVRSAAILTLGEMGPAARDFTEKLAHALRDPSFMVRYQAAFALRKVGDTLVPEVGMLLRDGDERTRAAAAAVAGLFGEDARELAADLEEALADDSAAVRAQAAAALGNIGPQAASALPRLVDLIQDPTFDVQVESFRAVLALGAAQPKKLLQALAQANEQGNWATPFVLAQFGPEGKDAVPHLIKAVQAKDPTLRLGAVWALGNIGAPAYEAAPALTKLLRQERDPQVRLLAAESLQRIGKDKQREEVRKFLQSQQALAQPWRKSVRPAPLADLTVAEKKRVGFQIALKSPEVQRYYDELAQAHIYLSLAQVPGAVAHPARRQLAELLDDAGPEALPSLMRAFHGAISYNLGFL
jgi:HEAT repeat protein